MRDVFISRPTWIGEEFKEGLDGFLSFLETHDLRPRTIGSSDYPTESPLDEVITLMDECEGAIILGYPQIYVINGKIKGSEKGAFQLPTEWNHIEATLAYANNKPLLVIHHKGITRGIFDRGAISKFIYEKDLTVSNWFLSQNIRGALMKWKSSIVQWQNGKSGVPTAISTPPSITPQPTSGRLDESVESVLLYLFKTSNGYRRTLKAICNELNCVTEAARYCTLKLTQEKMITRKLEPNSYEVIYTITSKGRSYVMNNKLIKI
jgi:hypothetical protein